MVPVTRQEARRRRAADPAWQEAFYELKSPKTSKPSKDSKGLGGSKTSRVSKVSSTPRTSKVQRPSKVRPSVCNRLLSLTAPTPPPTEVTASKKEILESSPAPPAGQASSSKVGLCNPSPAPPPSQATLSNTEISSPWLDEYGYPDWSYFKAIDWNAPSSVVRRGPSPQWSPKSLSPDSQPTLSGTPSLPLVNMDPANLELGTVASSRSFRKPNKVFKPKDSPRQSQRSSNHRSPQFKSIKKLNIKVISPNSERAPCTSPSCPVHPIPHKQGTYLHGGASPKNHFTFAWSNPPPEVWAAHQKNRHDEATEQELALIASFRAYHDQRAFVGGITTSGICLNEPVKVRECSFSF